jgi:hypothetical protein
MAGQAGWKTEVTWGTPITVDKFVPVTGSTLTVDQGPLRPAGIRAGRLTRSAGQPGAKKISGTLEMELPNVTVATLLKHLFGAVNTTGAGPTYTHTYTPGTSVGDSLTLQSGVMAANGTTYPFTASGVKPGSWDLKCAVGEFAMLSVDWTARDVENATALASASYAATLAPFTFVEGAISVNGTPVASANSVTLSFSKGLRDDRHVLGSRYIREQLEEEHWEITSEIEADFDDLTLYALADPMTTVASVFEFDNGSDTLVITCSGQVIGDPPSLTKIGLESQTIRLDHSSDVNDAGTITAVLVNTEASAA